MRRRRASGPPRERVGAAARMLLGRRDYTAVELRRKLTERGHALADVDATIQDLADRGLIDDRRVAAAHVRSAAHAKGRGRVRIRQELEGRGIDRAIVHELLAELSADDEQAAIRRVLVRKRWPAHPTLAERRRMFQHLMRRGFSADAIQRALRASDSDE